MLAEEAQTLYNELSNKRGIADTHRLLSSALTEQGEYARALMLAEQAATIYKELGDPWATTYTQISMAGVVQLQGDSIHAQALVEESLAVSIEAGYLGGIAFGLEQLATIVATQREPARTVLLWGAAEAVRETISAPILPIERAGYEPAVSRAHSQLGDEIFATLWAEGRAMTPDQALVAKTVVTIPEEQPTEEQLAIDRKPPSLPAYPDDLTAREVEVLRLLAQGWADAQIAEELVISPRTVNHHLTSIYRKIQVSTRIPATRYAIDHQLV